MNVKELATRTVESMLAHGLTPQTAWNEHGRVYVPIIKLHEAEGLTNFNREIITDYVTEIESRFECGEIEIQHYRRLKRGVQRLTEMHDTDKLEWTAPKKASGFVLNSYYEKILTKLIDGEDAIKMDLSPSSGAIIMMAINKKP